MCVKQKNTLEKKYKCCFLSGKHSSIRNKYSWVNKKSPTKEPGLHSCEKKVGFFTCKIADRESDLRVCHQTFFVSQPVAALYVKEPDFYTCENKGQRTIRNCK